MFGESAILRVVAGVGVGVEAKRRKFLDRRVESVREMVREMEVREEGVEEGVGVGVGAVQMPKEGVTMGVEHRWTLH